MNTNSFLQKPIRLVSVTEDGKYTIDEEGANFLSQVQKPIGIVSVAGMYRTGKSYLLNRMLLNKSSGFGVGNTINACTKGLWCWGTPIKGTTPEGQKINVIIIDSEGIAAVDQDQNHDTKIFTLAVLSASTFVYNSMGSIDENALQNLSLVVNLSKNIQINAHSEEDQVDVEELAQYFPSFCWVVRDFSLQLVNGNGEPISSNEYLERALALQKGFSDDIEDKNRIRRLLTSFFKQRECITLVRPLVNETKLQQLQKLQLDQLRPQFVQQVLQLRKKILFRLQPKKFNQQTLDGRMYLNMLQSYVQAINDGAVPNMQNAWSYMCQEKCNGSFEACLDKVEEVIKEIQESIKEIPMEVDRLNQECEDMEEEVVKKYLDQTKGMEREGRELLVELKQRVKGVIREIKKKNSQQAVASLKNYAFKQFQPIQKMMSQGQFTKYSQYIKQLNQFYMNLVQSAPSWPNKQLIFAQFTKKAAIQGAQVFLKSFTKSFQSKKALWQQQKSIMLRRQEQTKQQLLTQIKSKKQRLEQIDEQNTELVSQVEEMKHQIEQLKRKEVQQEKLFSEELKYRREEYERQSQELLASLGEVKVMLKEAEQEKYGVEKELEKLRALSQLKEQQYIEEVTEYKRKQEGQVGQMLKFRQQVQQQFQKQTQVMQQKVKQYKSRAQHSQSQTYQLKQHLTTLQQQLQQLTTQNTNLQTQHTLQTQQLTHTHQQTITKLTNQLSIIQSSYESLQCLNSELKDQLALSSETSDKVSQELQEKLNQQLVDARREKALYEQKITFLEMEMKELEEKSVRDVQWYEARIKQLQQQAALANQTKTAQKLTEITKNLQEQHNLNHKKLQSTITQLQTQLQTLTNQHSHTIYELSLQKQAKESQTTKYKKIIATIQSQLTQVKMANTEIYEKIVRESEVEKIQLHEKIKELEMELQTFKQQSQTYQYQRNNRSQEAIMQLKNYYELEKEKLEQKQAKEKEKFQKRLGQMKEEYEAKIQEIETEKEEEYQLLNNDFMVMEEQYKETLGNLQHDFQLKVKAYEGLEEQYLEQKTSFEKKQIQLFQKIQSLTAQLHEQQESLQKKIEELSKDKSKLQKQSITLNHQKQQLSNLLKLKQDKLTATQSQLSSINKQVETLKQHAKIRENELQAEFMQKTINYEKKIALNKQQNEFVTKKNQELEKFIQGKTKAYEEKIESLKLQLSTTVKSAQEKRVKQLSELEDKHEKLKKSSKESQSMLTKKLSQVEKLLAIEQEKSNNLQTRLAQFRSVNCTLEQKLASQLTLIKQTHSQQKSQLLSKLQHLKQSLSTLQAQKQATISQFDKDKILLQNKVKYLQENRQKTRKQSTDRLKKLEQTLNKLQKDKKQEKAMLQATYSQATKRLQVKHHEELKQMTKTHQVKEAELTERLSVLQQENRKLTTSLNASQGLTSEAYLLQERKLAELQDNEKRLVKEVEQLKATAKSQTSETFVLYEKEKQQLKTRLAQKEEKLRMAEKLKQEYFYELEKEKAKTNVEKESFVTKIDELKELITKHQSTIQKLQRQNQKLKVQKRTSVSKIQLGRYSVNKSHLNTDRSALEDSMSFLNVSVASSIRDNLNQSKDGRSFSKFGNTSKEYLKNIQARRQQKEEEKYGSDKFSSQKNSQKQKQNFNPILDEESFFNGCV